MTKLIGFETKKPTGDEQYDRAEHEWQNAALLISIKPGCNEQPELIEDKRGGDKQSATNPT